MNDRARHETRPVPASGPARRPGSGLEAETAAVHGRRRFLLASGTGLAALCAAGAGALAPRAARAQADASVPDADSERWRTLRKFYFGDREMLAGDAVLELDTPKRAHDAAVVPVSVHALDSSRPVRKLHLLVDDNPVPLAGVFSFGEGGRDWESLETRIRINEYTHVRAVAELDDGPLYVVSRFVKAAGGCSAPALADLDAAIAGAGRMKLLLGGDADAPPSSPITEAVVRISHPNNSGMQFDQVSRNYIPAFFVKEIEASVDGTPLFGIETNFSMSENPSVRLRYRAVTPPGELDAWAVDSKGNRYDASSAS